MPYRMEGGKLMIGVEGWRKVLAAGSATGTPQLEAVYSANWSDLNDGMQYMKDPFGWVHLRGQAQKGVAIVATDTIFQLPVGYRPAKSDTTSNRFAAGANSGVAIVFQITTGGLVQTIGTSGVAARTHCDGITFRAEDENP